MFKLKEILVTGFALFALFFGAGNLILPPSLGLRAGESWSFVAIGFCISAVFLPVLGIFAHAKLQGSIYDFGKPVGRVFSYLYCSAVYLIAISLPAPRTAAVTHEMAVAPFGEIPSWVTSSIYFAVVLYFILKRAIIINTLGKFLTPILSVVIFLILGIAFFSEPHVMMSSTLSNPLTTGILEGYQTFDAIGAVVIGGVLIISLNEGRKGNFKAKKRLIRTAGSIAGLGLLLIYAGMIWVGAQYSQEFEIDSSRTALLSGLSTLILGSFGTVALSILIALACFTTAVGILTGTADFVKGICGGSSVAYTITAILGCILGIVIGQFDVHYIIMIAVPALALIYPITIVLILLNVVPKKWAPPEVFKLVVLVTTLFSIPDVLDAIGLAQISSPLRSFIPLGHYSMGWVLPATLAFTIKNMVKR